MYVVQGKFKLELFLLQLPSASVRVRHSQSEFGIHLSLKCQGVESPNLQRCFLPTQIRVWNELPNTVFDTGTLDGFMDAANCPLLP